MPNIEFIPLQLVDDYDKNSNTHPQAQIENIKALMLYVGWTVPALVRKTGERYGLIAGHGRREAASELQGKPLKMADGTPIPAGCIPVLFADGWSDEQIRAYVIADNQVPRQSVFDESILAEELQALQDGGLDLGMIGFGEGELERLLASIEPEPEYQTDPDDAPEVDEESAPVSVRGMVWLCGNHRVMCGDSTSPEDVRKLMAGQKADMVFTDPPYRMKVEGGSSQPIGRAAAKLGEEIKHLCDFDPIAFLGVLPTVFENKKMNSFVFCNKDLVPDYLAWGVKCGYSFNILFWKKPNAIPLGGQWRPDVEYLLVFRKSGIWNNALSDVSYSKCLEFGRENSTPHPTMKPVDLIVNQIKISSNIDSVVLDFFGGSGSTLIACEKISRINHSIELDEKYVDVIIKRWQQFTGKDATLESDGRTFNEIASLCP